MLFLLFAISTQTERMLQAWGSAFVNLTDSPKVWLKILTTVPSQCDYAHHPSLPVHLSVRRQPALAFSPCTGMQSTPSAPFLIPVPAVVSNFLALYARHTSAHTTACHATMPCPRFFVCVTTSASVPSAGRGTNNCNMMCMHGIIEFHGFRNKVHFTRTSRN